MEEAAFGPAKSLGSCWVFCFFEDLNLLVLLEFFFFFKMFGFTQGPFQGIGFCLSFLSNFRFWIGGKGSPVMIHEVFYGFSMFFLGSSSCFSSVCVLVLFSTRLHPRFIRPFERLLCCVQILGNTTFDPFPDWLVIW